MYQVFTFKLGKHDLKVTTYAPLIESQSQRWVMHSYACFFDTKSFSFSHTQTNTQCLSESLGSCDVRTQWCWLRIEFLSNWIERSNKTKTVVLVLTSLAFSSGSDDCVEAHLYIFDNISSWNSCEEGWCSTGIQRSTVQQTPIWSSKPIEDMEEEEVDKVTQCRDMWQRSSPSEFYLNCHVKRDTQSLSQLELASLKLDHSKHSSLCL